MNSLLNLDDKALFSLIMEGNHRAYAEFYARYCISMGNQAYKLMGDREVLLISFKMFLRSYGNTVAVWLK
ncbi:hypothetical protein SAMN05216436_1046 [bacterium A37T11]|nr:hypothetical protein SAMN05216436_1046 [bacterium A37T11]